MSDNLFNTPEKRNLGVRLFTELQEHPGWQLFCKVIEANIENLKNDLFDPRITHTVEEDNRLRDKIGIFKAMTTMPADQINDLSPSDESFSIENLDPYETELT